MVAFLDGLFFSEILADNAGGNAFDTDGDGQANKADEFVEIQNSTGSAIDLSNYSLWSSKRGELFDWGDVPPATIAGGGTATVIGQYDGTAPAGFFDAGLPDNNSNQGLLEDGENTRFDTLYLVNDVTGEFIALEYGPNHPGNLALPTDPDFFGTTLVGSETTGSDAPNGTSIARDANGDLVNDTTPDPDTPGPVCFVEGTRILTPSGEVTIECLTPGDRVITRDHGAQTLRWVGRSVQASKRLMGAPELRPIRISRDAIAPGVPNRDLDVSPQHRIFVQSRIAQRMFGPDGVFVPAVKLLPLRGVHQLGAEAVTYIHLLFDRHEIVFAEGCPSESLLLGSMAQDCLGADAMAEIAELFPDLPATVPARELPKGHRIRRLVERHTRNPRRSMIDAA